MDAERWKRVEALFAEALALPAPARATFLDEAAGDDAVLRAEAESLLAAHDAEPTFLEHPAAWLTGEPGEDEEPVPDRIGPYRIVEVLGRGGMGRVYLAERTAEDFRRAVALKVMRRGLDTEDLLRRFRAERQILASLSHPNIARLYDAGATEAGLPYFVMEHIEGTSILEYCDRERLSILARLQLFRTVCAAVHHAHQSLVIHRDLKPGNILVTEAGEPKLLDFGIAKMLDPEHGAPQTELTRSGIRMLTPEFAAPEQLRGDVVTTACDVYALGVLLYELLAGVGPYGPAAPPQELERRILEVDPKPPRAAVALLEPDAAAAVAEARDTAPASLVRALAGDLDTIALKALRKEPELRYASALSLSEDLRRHERGMPVEARPATVGYRLKKFVRRNRVPVGATVALFLLLAVFSGVTAYQSERIREESARVARERDKALEVRSFLLETFGTTGPDQPTGDTVTVRDLLDRRAATIDDAYPDAPELRAEMLTVLAEGYEKLGLHEEAEPQARRALELRRDLFGAEHPDVLVSLNVLGWLQRELGRLEEAETMLREAVRTGRAVFPPDGDPRLARALNDLGVVLEARSRYDEAASLYRESIDMRRRHLGDDHLGVAITTSNLAVVLYRKGDLDGAVEMAAEAVALFDARLGPDHQRTVVARSNLAAMQSLLGDHEGAAEQQRAILERHRRILGPRHPNVARTLNLLASALMRGDRTEESEPLVREALDIQLDALGPRHERVAVTRRVLGDVLNALGRYEEAIEEERAALDIVRGIVGDTHRETARLRRNIGQNLVMLGRELRRAGRDEAARVRFREAERSALEAVRGFTETVGADNLLTLEAKLTLGHALEARGQLEAADRVLTEVETVLGPIDDPNRPERVLREDARSLRLKLGG